MLAHACAVFLVTATLLAESKYLLVQLERSSSLEGNVSSGGINNPLVFRGMQNDEGEGGKGEVGDVDEVEEEDGEGDGGDETFAKMSVAPLGQGQGQIPGSTESNAKNRVDLLETFRNAISEDNRRWTNGVIPFVIKMDKGSEKVEKMVKTSIMILNYLLKGCITFRPANPKEKQILTIKNGEGCGATAGMKKQGGSIGVSIYCGVKSTIHELIHSIGVGHEFIQPNRDKYVKVIWDHIKKKHKTNFVLKKKNRTFGVPYNFYSIMHYPLHAFRKKDIKHKTMVPLVPVDESGITFSSLPTRSDLTKIRRLYKCREPALPVKCPWKKMKDNLCVNPIKNIRMTFNAAVNNCKSLSQHGRLYEPWDYTTYLPLRNRLESDKEPGGPFWVGGKKKKGIKRASYLSIPTIPLGFMDCQQKKVSCHLEKPNLQCMAIQVGKGKSYMRFYPCDKKINFICEIPEK